MKMFSFILYMLLSFPIAAYSYTAKIDGIYYDFNGQKAVVTYQNSNGTLDYSGTIVIPMSVTYNGRIYSVTSIGSSAFYGCDGLTSITIPESVTSIGYSAFYNCSGLTSITIPESVTNIGHLAFHGCSGLQKVIVPDIAAWCNISFFVITGSSNPLFYACHLFYDEDTEITDLVIPDGVTSINDYAFVNCSDIASVTIPESVTAIGTSAFSGCHFSSDSFVNNSLLTHSGNWGATLYDEDTKDGLLINSNIVVRCRSWATNVTIPEDVTTIGNEAFSGCSCLISVSIPESVTAIGDEAFSDCSGLTSITIPKSVTTIGSKAFNGCSSLTSVSIPESVTAIGISAFAGCHFTSDSFVNNSSLTSNDNWGATLYDLETNDGLLIKNGVVVKCRLWATSVTISNDITSISSDAFSNCNGLLLVILNNNKLVSARRNSGTSLGSIFGNQVEAYVIGDSVTDIGSCAFCNCTNLSTVTIPNSVTRIGADAFKNCSGLTSVIIPENVTSIDDSAFSGCSGLISATIGNSVTNIGKRAFYGCNGLTSITIPESVTSIKQSAFGGCGGLEKIIVPDIGAWCNITFDTDANPLSNVHHLFSDEETEITNLVIPESVTTIGNESFSGCSGLTSVTIPESVTSIGIDAFSGCNGLRSVIVNNNTLVSATRTTSNSMKSIFGSQVEEYVIGDAVTRIGGYAFSNCTTLKSITIANSVTRIDDNAFNGCSSLTNVTVPIGVISIGSSAFQGCTNLESVTIPNSVNSIEYHAFSGCGRLKKVIVPDIAAWCGISLGDNPLYYAHHLFSDEETEITSFVIPENVTKISNYAFSGCSALASVTIPESVTAIGSYAFSGCNGLTSVIIPNSVTSIGNYAFQNCSSLKKVIVSDVAAWCNIRFGAENANPLYYAHHLFSDEEKEITNIFIPEGVTKISNYAFSGCNALASVTIPESVTAIGSDAFSGCNGLTSVIIPNSVTSIGDYAFSGCSGLTSITIPKSITSIGSYAFPNGTTIYTSIGKHLFTLWKAGYKNIKETKSERVLGIPAISSVATKSSSSTISIENYYPEFRYIVQMSDVSRTIERKDTCFTGLDPDTQYSVELSVTSDDVTYTSNTISFTTAALTLTTRQPRVVSSGNVVLAAESNLDDKETKVGFEWRRIDWTDDFFSNNCGAYLYEGTMESYIRNLYYMEHTLWKYRPYYESNLGNRYYGEWVGIDPTNTNYYEPSVHTYTTINVEGNTAEVEGYAMRGSDNIFKQGFMYWKKDSKAKSIPANAMMVEAKGNQMFATLENLDYDTEYCYVAFVTTFENETFYGKEHTFKTDLSQDMIDGIVETNNVQSSGSNVHSIYDLNGRKLSAPQKGINIIHMSDGARRKVMIM